MFDDLVKKAYEIPLISRMRYLTELQTPWGLQGEPILNADIEQGLHKIATIIKGAQDSEERTALELERQAMIDPQVQMALDYQQVRNERDDLQAQMEGMNQQLFDTQSQMAMADQQAQTTGQQVADLQMQLEQETVGRQQAQQEMIASKDQSLQEQMTVQDQKQQMNDAAQMFQEQANMLTQQLKGIAAQPTAPPPMPMEPGMPPEAAQPGMEGMPPPASAGAAQEQQEAANAQQEAAIQGQQAVQATDEDMMKQEQAAAMADQQAAQGMMPKQGADIAAMDRVLGFKKEAKIGLIRRGIERIGKSKADSAQAVAELAPLARALGKNPTAKEQKKFRETLVKSLMGMGDRSYARGKKRLAIGGAGIGTLGLGAYGVSKLRSKKDDKDQIPKTGAILPEWYHKLKEEGRLDPMSEEFAKNQAFGRAVGSGGGIGIPIGAAIGGVGGAAAGGRYGLPGVVGGSLLGALAGGTAGGAIGTELAYPAKLRQQLALLEERRGKAEDKKLRQLLPEEQMPKTSADLSKCSGCGKMTKLSELGKCSACSGKHKQASVVELADRFKNILRGQ